MTTKYLVTDPDAVQEKFDLPTVPKKFATEELDQNAVSVQFVPPLNAGSSEPTIREISVSKDLIDDLRYQNLIEVIN